MFSNVSIYESQISMKSKTMSGIRLLICCVLGLAGWGLVSQVQAQSARFIPSADGSEVMDMQTYLVWSRCTLGQTWNGSVCAGFPLFISHEAALANAKTQTGWRLPNVKELSSLVDTTLINPAMNSTVFGGVFNKSYWSSTPDVRNPTSAWSVDFSIGGVNSIRRSTLTIARLVR
jgi:hypothetical protein